MTGYKKVPGEELEICRKVGSFLACKISAKSSGVCGGIES